jgi:hypothetical protein
MAMIMDFINWWKDAWDVFLMTLPPLKVSLSVLGVFFIMFSYPFIKEFIENKKFEKEWNGIEKINFEHNRNSVTLYSQYNNEVVPRQILSRCFCKINDVEFRDDKLYLDVVSMNFHSGVNLFERDTIPVDLNSEWNRICYNNKKYCGKSLYKFYTDWKNEATLKAIEELE